MTPPLVWTVTKHYLLQSVDCAWPAYSRHPRRMYISNALIGEFQTPWFVNFDRGNGALERNGYGPSFVPTHLLVAK